MALAFSLEALAILVLFAFLDNPVMFVLLTGVVFFGWGEIFSPFPSTLTDTFGPKFATTNYGFLYMAQGVGSILGGPAAAFLKQMTGAWAAVFMVVVSLNALTAFLPLTALRAMRWRYRTPAEPRSAREPDCDVKIPPSNARRGSCESGSPGARARVDGARGRARSSPASSRPPRANMLAFTARNI
jgi:MFS family permease